MKIKIFNVEHGACALITYPNGRRTLVDTGCSDAWWPSIEFYGQPIDGLVMQNLDLDHMSDLVDVVKLTGLKQYFSNPTIGAKEFLAMKWRAGGWPDAFETAYQMFSQLGTNYGQSYEAGPGCWSLAAWNVYGRPFTDTNNLSVPLLVGRGEFTILFGGDLEREGWDLVLRNADFRSRLASVKVYVASHHGRENGRSDELFRYISPQVVIVSDCEIRHGTQENINWYVNRATGIRDTLTPRRSFFDPEPIRRVLTTRRDGGLCIEVDAAGNFVIVPERFWMPKVGRNALLNLPSLT